MASTLQQEITSQWQQVSEGDCTMQSEKTGITYHVVVSIEQPTVAKIALKLDEPTTFAYKTPVWVRLESRGNDSNKHIINIIK